MREKVINGGMRERESDKWENERESESDKWENERERERAQRTKRRKG